MSKLDNPKVSSKFFASYSPKRREFIACIDATEHCSELEIALYERVRAWTVKHEIVLGEGYTFNWSTENIDFPASMSMFAPVISAGRHHHIAGMYNSDTMELSD